MRRKSLRVKICSRYLRTNSNVKKGISSSFPCFRLFLASSLLSTSLEGMKRRLSHRLYSFPSTRRRWISYGVRKWVIYHKSEKERLNVWILIAISLNNCLTWRCHSHVLHPSPFHTRDNSKHSQTILLAR